MALLAVCVWHLSAANISAAPPARVFNILDYAATANDSTDDTTSIQRAIDDAESYLAVSGAVTAHVKIPDGVYLVGDGTPAGTSAVSVGVPDGIPDNIVVKGSGTLKLAGLSNADAILALEGEHVIVNGVRFDGNASGNPTGRGECLRVNGNYCSLIDVMASNTSAANDHSTGCTYFINTSAFATLLQGCSSTDCGASAISNRGDWTIIRNFRAINHQGSGLATAGGDRDCLIIDGWYGESNVPKKTGMLIDNGVDSHGQGIGYGWKHVFLSNVALNFGDEGSFGNGIKVARVHHLHLDNVCVKHSSRAFDSLRLAEAIGTATIRQCDFSNNIFQEKGAYDIGGEITGVGNNGRGLARFTSAGHRLKSGDFIVITGTTNYNGVHEVATSDPSSGTFDTNWRFVANDAGIYAAGMGRLVIEDTTIGTIGDKTCKVCIRNIRAETILISNCRLHNFTDSGIQLMNNLLFPHAGFKSVIIEDSEFVSNSSSPTYCLRASSSLLSASGILRIQRDSRRSLGTGTLSVSKSAATPSANPNRRH